MEEEKENEEKKKKEEEEEEEEEEEGEGEGGGTVEVNPASGKAQIPLLNGKFKASFWTCSTLV